MSSPGSSVKSKVKYAGTGKQKRKRATAAETSDHSDSEEEPKPTATPPKSKSKANAEMKPPSYIPASPGNKSKAPKKVDVHLPGPSPKRQKKDDEDNASVASESKGKKKAPLSKSHHRSTSSVSSATRLPKPPSVSGGSPASVSGSIKKPISASRLAPAPVKQDSPDTEINDNASVADSTMSIGGTSRIRRTEPERIEYFKNQPECADCEAHRALCNRCNKWVSLGKQQTYTVRPWETHRSKCDQKVFDFAESHASKSPKGGLRTEPERKALLEADTRADVVEPNRILCKKCRKWTKMTIKYEVGPWRKHLETCNGPVPSSRVATAERKIQIHNDPVATPLGPNEVKCLGCDDVVQLDGGEYNLSAWETHKVTCDKAQALLKLKQSARSKAIVRASSVASTEATIAVPEGGASASPPSLGTKRRRADVDAEDAKDGVDLASDQRAAKIQKDENYVAPDKEAPGPFGWFMMPFQAFFKGFKESIQSATK